MFDKLVFALGLKKREASVLVIGLDNSGKSTMLNHFKSEDQKSTEIVPTVGFNVEKFKGEDVMVWEGQVVAVQHNTQSLHSHYLCVTVPMCEILYTSIFLNTLCSFCI